MQTKKRTVAAIVLAFIAAALLVLATFAPVSAQAAALPKTGKIRGTEIFKETSTKVIVKNPYNKKIKVGIQYVYKTGQTKTKTITLAKKGTKTIKNVCPNTKVKVARLGTGKVASYGSVEAYTRPTTKIAMSKCNTHKSPYLINKKTGKNYALNASLPTGAYKMEYKHALKNQYGFKFKVKVSPKSIKIKAAKTTNVTVTIQLVDIPTVIKVK